MQAIWNQVLKDLQNDCCEGARYGIIEMICMTRRRHLGAGDVEPGVAGAAGDGRERAAHVSGADATRVVPGSTSDDNFQRKIM